VKEGYRLVGFVHDEILIELPDEGGSVSLAQVRRVQEILCRCMEEVLVGGIPVNCEPMLSHRWHKKAKLLIEGDRVVPWSPS
jgi:hypothetical protein